MMSAYTATDNLEVMAEAVNYNAFLIDSVRSFAQAGDRILDFGAGIGTIAERLVAEGYAVTCLEPDIEQRQRLRAQGLSTCEALEEIADGSLDYLFTINVLEHIERDGDAVAAFARKLRPGGRLLIYVPAFALLFSSMDRKVGHFRRYRRGALACLVAANGFGGISARYADSLGFLAALLYRALGRDDGGINRRALKLYDRFVFPLSRLLDRAVGRLFGKNVMLTAVRRTD